MLHQAGRFRCCPHILRNHQTLTNSSCSLPIRTISAVAPRSRFVGCWRQSNARWATTRILRRVSRAPQIKEPGASGSLSSAGLERRSPRSKSSSKQYYPQSGGIRLLADVLNRSWPCKGVHETRPCRTLQPRGNLFLDHNIPHCYGEGLRPEAGHACCIWRYEQLRHDYAGMLVANHLLIILTLLPNASGPDPNACAATADARDDSTRSSYRSSGGHRSLGNSGQFKDVNVEGRTGSPPQLSEAKNKEMLAQWENAVLMSRGWPSYEVTGEGMRWRQMKYLTYD